MPSWSRASLDINKAFRSPVLTFFITICMLSASRPLWGRSPRGSCAFSVDWSGCQRTSGLVIVVIIVVIALVDWVNDPAVLLQFTVDAEGGSAILAVLAGVSLAFFAMTVARTIDHVERSPEVINRGAPGQWSRQ